MSASEDGDFEQTAGPTVTIGGRTLTFWELMLISAPAPVAGFLIFIANAPERATNTLVGFSLDPIGTIRTILVEIVFRDLLFPLAVGIYNSGVALVDIILVIFLGTDRQAGIAFGSQPGVLEFPLVILNPIASIIGLVFFLVIEGIGEFNLFVASLAQGLGLAGPPVITGLIILEIAAVAWGFWIAFQTIDVFTGGILGEIVGVGMAITRPFRNIIDFLLRRD